MKLEGALPDPSEPGRNFELDIRRQFIRELGASRMTAHALAVRTFKVKDFNLRYFQRKRFRLSVELGDSRQNVVDAEVLRAIGEAVEKKQPDLESPPRTPSPPRNIDWHNVNRDNSPVRNNDRSRPRNRQQSGNFQDTRDSSREFVERMGPERDQEPFNRNAGPKNSLKNRYNRITNSDNRNAKPDEFNRSNRNANPQEFNRNNRNANQPENTRNNRNANNTQEFNSYNRNSDEFNRNNRNTNRQPEFHRNVNPQMEFNQNIRNENPEIIRNNRIVNPQTTNRNPNTQESYRNNRNNEFNRRQEINRNDRHASPQDFNRNPQEFNRNIIDQESNRNMNPQGNRNLPLNPREVRNAQSNRRAMPPSLGANPVAKSNIRGALLPTPQDVPPNLNNLRFTNNRGPHRGPGNNDFMSDEEEDIDGTPIIDQLEEIYDNFLESRERQHPSPHSDFRQMKPNFAEDGGPPQIGRKYQRIVNNDQITICREDWIEAQRMELVNRNPNHNENIRNRRSNQFEDQGDGYNDDPMMDMEDDERFHRQQQQDQFRRPGFRGPENEEFRNYSNDRYDRNVESNQGNIRVHRNNDSNYLGRGRNDRNDSRHFNADGYENDRAQSNDSVTFRGSKKPDVSPKRYQRGPGPGDRTHRDHHPQPPSPNQNRSNKGRNAPNPRQIRATSQDRTMTRNTNSSGRNPESTSKASQDRNPSRNTSTGGPRTHQDRNPRSTSSASQSRNTSGGEKPGKDRSTCRSARPEDASLRKPIQAGPKNPAGVALKSRVSTQTKPNRPESEASMYNQARANASWEQARAGQKRNAETKESDSSPPPKVDIKRKRITASQPAFIIAGIRLPHINTNKKKLPQSEDDSYAVTFFEQTPLYNTNIYAIDDGQIDDADAVESDAESMDSNQSGSGSKGSNKLVSKQMIRNKLRREWMAIYRENNYKDWYAWWKDYKWCGTEINKELDKHGDRKMRHRFMFKYPTTEIMVREIFRCGRNGLEKNTFNHYRNMRSIFLLMNETFLEALSEEEQEKLQNLIRYIPNHLWLYKIRSMVYLWERYHRILKTLDERKVHKENELSAIAREWKDPLFHWLAKQAFDELKAISGVAWPDHKELYHGL